MRHFAILALLFAPVFPVIAQHAADQPETVMITFRAKPGAEDELGLVIAQHWTAATAMHLLSDTPHVTVRGTENGKTYFVDIFTWRDAHTPDAAPAEIRKIWSQMNRLVESRDGRPGLEFAVVSVVAPQPR